ncbi:MAG: hypothetical protein ABSD46_05900 [Bacteroidota bacterium]
MKSSLGKTSAGRSIYVLLISALVTLTAFGQSNLVITGAPTLGGTGTYNIKGNITNTVAIAINPTVTMNGAAAQTIGTTGAITLTTLNVNTTGATPTTTMNVAVDVNTGLSVAAGSTFVVGANQLNISQNSTLNGTGTLSTVAGSTVVYDQLGTTQAVLGGFTYNGALTLSNTSTKTLGGDVTVAGAFSHTGGTLTLNNNLTISSATPSFATIADVATGKTLNLSGTGGKSITTVTTTTGTGAISNTGASGLLTIGTLSGNNGSISGGAGGVTFTNAATNAGTITGGAAAITFSSTLAHSAGTITAGSGGVVFNGIVTTTGGSIASSAVGNLLSFNANLTNTSGTIDLTLTGAAKFTGSVANTAGLNFANGSTVTYDGASGQTIANVNYGNLTLKTGTKTWTLTAGRTINGTLDIQAGAATTVNGSFDLTVLGNITLANNLTKSANAVLLTNIGSSVSGANEIVGSVTRTHIFTALSPYTFNNVATIVTPTAVGGLTSFTITSLPATPPTGYLLGNSVNRKYTPSYVAGSAFTADVQLGYVASEYTGSSQTKLKFFQGVGGIVKANKIGGTYTPGTSGSFSFVKLAALVSTNLMSATELGIDDRFNSFISIANNNWNNSLTWSLTDPSLPSINDDVNIIGTHTVTIPDTYTASALSVTIDGTTANTLTVGGGASGILNVGAGGLTNNATLGVLTVNTNAIVTITSSNLATGGTITNNGVINVQ